MNRKTTSISNYIISEEPKQLLAHEFSDTDAGFWHRARTASRGGEWVDYKSIAVVEIEPYIKYYCTTEYWHGVLPEAFEIKELKENEY